MAALVTEGTMRRREGGLGLADLSSGHRTDISCGVVLQFCSREVHRTSWVLDPPSAFSFG